MTGLVVVGDLIGAGAAAEQAVVGETPNLAARAEPGAVLIAGRLTGGYSSIAIGAQRRLRVFCQEGRSLGGFAPRSCRRPVRGNVRQHRHASRWPRGRDRAVNAPLGAPSSRRPRDVSNFARFASAALRAFGRRRLITWSQTSALKLHRVRSFGSALSSTEGALPPQCQQNISQLFVINM